MTAIPIPKMTDKQRMDTLLKREKPDRVPVWPLGYPGFAALNATYTINDAYSSPEKAFESQQWCAQQYGWIFTPLFFYGSWGCWEFGGEIKWPTREFDQAPLITRHPVKSSDDVLKLRHKDIAMAGMVPRVAEFVQLAMNHRKNGEGFSILLPVGGPFSIASNLCGVEQLCKWSFKKPDVVHRLLRVVTDHSLALFAYWKDKFGTDGFMPFVGEPAGSNQLISPKQFEEFVMPYLQELHEKILGMGYKHIYCHVCGEANANLPYWSQIPMGDPGVVSFGHEVDILKAAEYFPNDVVMGNLEPSIIQMGTPQEVYENSVSIIEKGMRCSGGFAFSPGCEMPPMAPPINIWMMTKAANDVGWYV
jgi:uroporphyrinogen decarboxylase